MTTTPPRRYTQGLSITGGTSRTAETDEVKAAGGECLLIRHVRFLFQRIQAIGFALCAAFDAHSLLHRQLPRTPVLKPRSTVTAGLGGEVTSSCPEKRSETTDVSVAPEFEPNCRFKSSLLPNTDLEPCSTEARGLEHCPARCSETKSSEVVSKSSDVFPESSEVVTILSKSCEVVPILPKSCEVVPKSCEVVPKSSEFVPRNSEVVPIPKSSEVVSEPDVSRSLVHRLPKPVRATAYNLSIPPGFEKIWVKKRETNDSDIVSRPAVSLSMISQPLKPVPESGSPRGPRLEDQVFSSCSEATDSEEAFSSCSETTDSEVVLAEVVRRLTIPLARIAGLVSGAERAGDPSTVTSCFSESSDSDIVPESEMKCDFIRRPHKGARAFSVRTVPKVERISVGSSPNLDLSALSDPEGRRAVCFVDRTPVPPRFGKEGPPDLEQTDISCSYSDTKDSDVLSDSDRPSVDCETSATVAKSSSSGDEVASGVLSAPAKQRFTCEAKDSATVAANSSSGVFVLKEPEGVTFGNLNPNAKEFVPGASKCGDALVRAKEDWDLQQRLKLSAEQLTLGWIEGKSYSPFSVPSSPLDLGTALKLNHEGIAKWTKRTRGHDHFGQSPNADVYLWGSGLKTASNGIPGRPKDLKSSSGNNVTTPPLRLKDRRPSHGEANGNATVAAKSSTGVLVLEEPKVTKEIAKGSEGVGFGMLNPNAKDFAPRASKVRDAPGDALVRAKEDSDLQQRLKLNAEQLSLGWIEGKSCSPFPVPRHSPLDLGAALKLNYETKSNTKWRTRGNDFGQSSDAEVVWGSPGLKKASTGIHGRAQDRKFPSRNTFATPPQRRNERRQCHRPIYQPRTPMSTVPKGRPVKA